MRTVQRHVPVAVADSTVEAVPLPLDYEARKRSRQRLQLEGGDELAIALLPGTVLHQGDLLEATDGSLFRVVARAESVLRVSSDDPWLLLRAAYHLGNRHVPVAVQPQALLLEPDPVLRDMLERIGLEVTTVEAPFEPESGAYGGGHRHGHDVTFDADYALAQALYDEYAGNTDVSAHLFARRLTHG